MDNAVEIEAPALSLSRSFADLMHPQNEGVMVTGDPEIFRDKSLSKYFKARILEHAEEQKSRIEKLFRSLYPQINETNDVMYLEFESGKKSEFITVPEIYAPIREDVDLWMQYYADLSGERSLETLWNKEVLFRQRDLHLHDFAVLNINGLSPGSICENITAPKGNLLFFEAGVKHGPSIPKKNEQKLLALVSPMGAV